MRSSSEMSSSSENPFELDPRQTYEAYGYSQLQHIPASVRLARMKELQYLKKKRELESIARGLA